MDGAVKLLKELLTIRSVNGRDDEGAVAEYLCKYFEQSGISAHIQRIDATHANPVSALHGQKPLPDFLPVSIEGRTSRALQRLIHILPADPESTSGCVLFISIYVIQRRANPQPYLFHSIRLKRKRQKLLPDIPGEKMKQRPHILL